MRLLKQRFDGDAKEAKQTRLKNLEEDLDEAKVRQNRLEDDKVRYDQETVRVKSEILELEQKKGKKKDILEDMNAKLKIELDRVEKEKKVQ